MKSESSNRDPALWKMGGGGEGRCECGSILCEPAGDRGRGGNWRVYSVWSLELVCQRVCVCVCNGNMGVGWCMKESA